VVGLVSAEVASTTTDHAPAFGKAIEQIEGELVAPWLDGPAVARTQMLHRLGELDASVPELLHGAWDDVMRGGPAATAKVAACAVEALERTLRALAPDAVGRAEDAGCSVGQQLPRAHAGAVVS
jgi:hypothetical protein